MSNMERPELNPQEKTRKQKLIKNAINKELDNTDLLPNIPPPDFILHPTFYLIHK